jgi:hypothetical protein
MPWIVSLRPTTRDARLPMRHAHPAGFRANESLGGFHRQVRDHAAAQPRPRSPAPEGIVSSACFYVGWFLLCLAFTHRVAIGAWLNARAARKTLRLLHDCSSSADVCIAFSGLYLAARRET